MTAPVLFQFMPPLLPSEYAALTESIKAHGVQVPVIVDESGAIIDGHHRDQIATELGIDCPREVRVGLSDTEKRGLAITLNRDRRHLSRSQIQALVAESLKADPQLSDLQHAKRTGVHNETVAAARRRLVESGDVTESVTRTDTLGRQQPATKPDRIDPATGEVLTETSTAAGSGEAPAAVDLNEWRRDQLQRAEDEGLIIALTGPNSIADPPKVTGPDGKQYTRPEPSTPRRKALPEQFLTATLALTDKVKAIVRLAEDDRFTSNTEKVATANRSDLIRAIDALTGVVAKLPERNIS